MRLALAALVLALAGCTAHAPVRGSATAVETSDERLACEEGRREAQAHAVEVHPEFTLAIVELDDQGRFWDRRQLFVLERTLEAEGARPGNGGLLVTLFAHGWQHDGSLCDRNVACFRTFLAQIARDSHVIARASGGLLSPRRVVGIFVAWRGRSGTQYPFSALTFWARKRVAHRIGAGDLVELLTRVDLAVKRLNRASPERAGLVIIGHSFGGTMVYDALANILTTRVVEALLRERDGAGGQADPGSASDVIEGFGDLVVLVNPAFEAERYRSLHELTRAFRRFAPEQGPVLVILASETDGWNRTWFPLGRRLETVWERSASADDRRAMRTSVGSFDAFVGYRLEAAAGTRHAKTSEDELGAARGRCACALELDGVDEIQLREITRRVAALRDPRRADDSPGRVCGIPVSYGRAELTCSTATNPRNPFWVVRASDDVIHGHSGFFTNAYVDFMGQMVLEAVTRRTSHAAVSGSPVQPADRAAEVR